MTGRARSAVPVPAHMPPRRDWLAEALAGGDRPALAPAAVREVRAGGSGTARRS